MKNKINFSLLVVSLLASLVFLPQFAFAVDIGDIFGLTYSLPEGGANRIELNPSNPLDKYKTVEITVSKKLSGTVQQFKMTQKLEQLRGVNDPSQVIKRSFVVRRITESFPAGGRFDVQSSDPGIPVRPGENRIYLSDSTGTALDFKLVYGIVIDESEKLEAGDYSGQITFIIEPVGSGTATGLITKILYVEVTIPAAVEGNVEIVPISGLNTILLNSQKEEKKVFDVGVKISGGFNRVFSIIQRIPEPLLSNEGNQLDYNVINVQTSDVSKGMGIPLTSLSSREQTIYTSGPNGEAPESFVITYSLGDLSGQKAGRYKSKIQFYLKKAEEPPVLLETMSLEVENERIFELVVTPQDSKGTISFVNLKPTEPPRLNEVILEVKTNTGKQYQVTQRVNSDLTNKEGGIIPKEFFTLRTEKVEGFDIKGTLKFPEKQEVKQGETVLFVSDGSGSPAKFKVVYELTITWDVKAGDYSTGISYSLVEL